MTTKMIRRIVSPNDLDQIKAIAQPLIGELCWKAGFSYGDELVLDFGERIPYKTPRGIQENGSWSLGTRGTNWELKLAGKIVLTSDAEPEVMREQSKQIEGHHLRAIDIGYPRLDLTLTFENNLQLQILPEPDDDEFDEIAYWELFTPDDHLLSVGPKLTWSYGSSKVSA
jgi:hypothetical protein